VVECRVVLRYAAHRATQLLYRNRPSWATARNRKPPNEDFRSLRHSGRAGEIGLPVVFAGRAGNQARATPGSRPHRRSPQKVSATGAPSLSEWRQHLLAFGGSGPLEAAKQPRGPLFHPGPSGITAITVDVTAGCGDARSAAPDAAARSRRSLRFAGVARERRRAPPNSARASSTRPELCEEDRRVRSARGGSPGATAPRSVRRRARGPLQDRTPSRRRDRTIELHPLVTGVSWRERIVEAPRCATSPFPRA